jgi:hypothetical protein
MSKEIIEKCKDIFNKELVKCIEQHQYTIKYCGSHYYNFIKCMDKVK